VFYASVIFFFQAEDGIRDRNVTGVQTCALPILRPCPRQSRHCESVLLEQMSPLSCYEVKASACSASHFQAYINVRILYPVIYLRSEERRVGKECSFRR